MTTDEIWSRASDTSLYPDVMTGLRTEVEKLCDENEVLERMLRRFIEGSSDDKRSKV